MAVLSMAETYFVHTHGNRIPVGMFKSHPFSKDRLGFIGSLQESGLLPRSEGIGEYWRSLTEEILGEVLDD